MKLNNKGFAFSTLLYGLLAVIIVIMAVLLAMYRQSNNESYYYSSVLEESLNKCVEQELALENCYRGAANDSDCSVEAYYSCLGYDDMLTKAKKVDFANTLATHLATSGAGLYEVSDHNLKYVYKGNDPHNYVKFSGMLWRIVGITANGETKIVLPGIINDDMAWDSNGDSEWSNSTLSNYLNNDFYDSLTSTHLIYKYDWGVGRIDSTEVGSLKKKEYKDIMFNATFSSKIGLLSPADIAYATLSNCSETEVIYNSSRCQGDWLKGRETWLMNSAKTEQNKAYLYNSGNLIVAENIVDKDASGNITNVHKHKIVPALYLSSDTQMLQDLGDGTSGSPYILEG